MHTLETYVKLKLLGCTVCWCQSLSMAELTLCPSFCQRWSHNYRHGEGVWKKKKSETCFPVLNVSRLECLRRCRVVFLGKKTHNTFEYPITWGRLIITMNGVHIIHRDFVIEDVVVMTKLWCLFLNFIEHCCYAACDERPYIAYAHMSWWCWCMYCTALLLSRVPCARCNNMYCCRILV